MRFIARALHCPCAVIGLFVSLMTAFLLASPALAGSYSSPTMGGTGQWYSGYSQPTLPRPYSTSSSGLSGGAGTGDSSGQINSFGTVTAVYTWSTPATDPAPPCIVMQFCQAYWYGTYTSTPGSSCSNGLGDAEIKSVNGQNYQGNSRGTHYSLVLPDASGAIKLTLSGAQSHTPATNLGVYASGVSYSCTAYPITISLGGTTPDSNGALNVLTGGQVTATLNCPFPVTSYSWSVLGATAPNPFLTWDPTLPNSNYPTQFVALSSTDMTKDSFSFYDAHNADSITVQCTATVQPPSGPALTITAKSPNITYIKPTVNWVVNRSYDSIPVGFFDGLPNGPFGSRELWGPITITEPPLFLTPGNPNTVGFGVVVQLASPSRSNTRVPLNGKPATYSKLSVVLANGTAGALSSPTGLDGAFPYYGGYYKNTDGTFTPVDGNYGWLAYNDGYSGDMPEQPYRNSDQDSGGNAWNASSASDSFDTWVMYRPASVAGQGTIYVPLQKLSWNWGATANLDQYNSWGVNQPQVFVSGSPAYTDVYPAWSLEIPLNPTIGP